MVVGDFDGGTSASRTGERSDRVARDCNDTLDALLGVVVRGGEDDDLAALRGGVCAFAARGGDEGAEGAEGVRGWLLEDQDVVLRVDDAAFGGVGGVEGWLHGAAFDGPVCKGKVLVDDYDYGEPKEEADCFPGCGVASKASVEGASAERWFARWFRCGFDFRGSFRNNVLGLWP